MHDCPSAERLFYDFSRGKRIEREREREKKTFVPYQPNPRGLRVVPLQYFSKVLCELFLRGNVLSLKIESNRERERWTYDWTLNFKFFLKCWETWNLKSQRLDAIHFFIILVRFSCKKLGPDDGEKSFKKMGNEKWNLHIIIHTHIVRLLLSAIY